MKKTTKAGAMMNKVIDSEVRGTGAFSRLKPATSQSLISSSSDI
jgi:hypothetical protein